MSVVVQPVPFSEPKTQVYRLVGCFSLGFCLEYLLSLDFSSRRVVNRDSPIGNNIFEKKRVRRFEGKNYRHTFPEENSKQEEIPDDAIVFSVLGKCGDTERSM